MNKEELVKDIAAKATRTTGMVISQNIARACLDGFITAVQQQTAKRKDVVLVGFGTFTTADRAARMGRNPQNKEEIEIAAKVAPVFKPGSDLKAATSKLKVRKGTKTEARPVVAEEVVPAETETAKAPKAPKTPTKPVK